MKHYQNMKNLPMVDIEVTEVCPPLLHIKQGCVKRHYSLMEKHAFRIDVLFEIIMFGWFVLTMIVC